MGEAKDLMWSKRDASHKKGFKPSIPFKKILKTNLRKNSWLFSYKIIFTSLNLQIKITDINLYK